MSRLFGAYIVVDYSAAEGKKTGESSVWIGVIRRDVRFRPTYDCHNPATRLEAMSLLQSLIADFKKRGEKVFLGLDFGLGFARGTAKKLGLNEDSPQKSLWKFLAKEIIDKPDNSNNRFMVAAKMNRLMTDAAYPFWGCPKSAAQKWLSSLKPDSYGEFPEYRYCEDYVRTHRKAQAKSLWQMHGAGVVGGQTMLGIHMLSQLFKTEGTSFKTWPFDFGADAITPDDLEACDVVCCEIYPSLYKTTPLEDEVKDAAQVRVCALTFSELDEQGLLSSKLALPKSLTEDEQNTVLLEEGWILGA